MYMQEDPHPLNEETEFLMDEDCDDLDENNGNILLTCTHSENINIFSLFVYAPAKF